MTACAICLTAVDLVTRALWADVCLDDAVPFCTIPRITLPGTCSGRPVLLQRFDLGDVTDRAALRQLVQLTARVASPLVAAPQVRDGKFMHGSSRSP